MEFPLVVGAGAGFAASVVCLASAFQDRLAGPRRTFACVVLAGAMPVAVVLLVLPVSPAARALAMLAALLTALALALDLGREPSLWTWAGRRGPDVDGLWWSSFERQFWRYVVTQGAQPVSPTRDRESDGRPS